MLPIYPNPVDETDARLTAGAVVVINAVALGAGQFWLLPIVAADYCARAVWGPRFSPLARSAHWLAPRLGFAQRIAAGPPKRFAATVGAAMMIATSILFLDGPSWAAYAVGAIMILFPALESFVGLCIGCKIFRVLMNLGAIPQDVCMECSDIGARIRRDPAPEQI